MKTTDCISDSFGACAPAPLPIAKFEPVRHLDGRPSNAYVLTVGELQLHSPGWSAEACAKWLPFVVEACNDYAQRRPERLP